MRAKTRAATQGSAVVQSGKISEGAAETRENHVDGEVVEVLIVVEAQDGAVATAASTANRMKRPTRAGSQETISQVQATIQGTTLTAATMKTGAAVERRSRSQETP